MSGGIIVFKALSKILIGKPLESARMSEEKFSVPKGLAILSSDSLSSVAYAGEEILHVLVPVIGLLSFDLLTPISAAIIVLLFMVSFSFKQIIDAYPKTSGGAYIVAKENLGMLPGLVAAAALLFDYVLTVAVSVSAGVAAFTSAYNEAIPYRVLIAVLVVAFLVIMNLRGVTESATFFSYPTFGFIIGMFLLIAVGLFKVLVLGDVAPPVNLEHVNNQEMTGLALVWLVMRAFSSGCTALTGVEAISDAVPNFKEPEAKHAKRVLTLLSILLFLLFGGLSVIINYYHIAPSENMTVISQVAHQVFGGGIFFYLFQVSTGLILVLAANTAFSGFPLLASLVARDGFLPRYLALRGSKLVYSNGIVALGLFAVILIMIFGGITTKLIPLYAVGVFTSFTLAQVGMVKRWLNLKPLGWQRKMLVNGLGAITTGLVTIIIGVTKFVHGAWFVVILIPAMIYVFMSINKHYRDIRSELDFDNYKHRNDVRHKIIVPTATLTNIVANTVDYAKTLSADVKAVHVSIDEEVTNKLLKKWQQWNPGVELVVIPSPFRSVMEPLVNYVIEQEKNKHEDEIITVFIPEFVTVKWWHRFLHNQQGIFLQNLLILKTEAVVTTVPYHLHN